MHILLYTFTLPDTLTELLNELFTKPNNQFWIFQIPSYLLTIFLVLRKGRLLEGGGSLPAKLDKTTKHSRKLSPFLILSWKLWHEVSLLLQQILPALYLVSVHNHVKLEIRLFVTNFKSGGFSLKVVYCVVDTGYGLDRSLGNCRPTLPEGWKYQMVKTQTESHLWGYSEAL